MIGALVFVAACAVSGAVGGAILRYQARRDAPYWSGVCAALDLPDVDTERVVVPFRGRPVLFDQNHDPESAA